MLASRFNGDFDRTESIGAKILAAASSLKINMHRDGDKVMMSYHMEGDFGGKDLDEDWPTVNSDEAKATARELMRAFLGK